MSRIREIASLCFVVLCLAGLGIPLRAQAQSDSHPRPLITQNIDESRLVRLGGNTRPEATRENDRGIVNGNFAMDHMLLQLRRAPEQEKSLEQFIEELHNPQSPNFHNWLTAEGFGQRYGLAQQDVDTITHWLESYGLKINIVYPSRVLIDFSGTAEQVRRAFHTEIHRLDARGESHIANIVDPQIPEALSPAVVGIVSLNDFRPHPLVKLHRDYTFNSSLAGQVYAVVPGDLATIYNFTPLFNSGISGQGQTIVVIEDGDLFSMNDWSTFRSTFGLSSYSGTLSQVHPQPPSGSTNNCSDPGVIGTTTNPVDAEAILDAEYASAAAPGAAIELASCSDTTTTFGGLIALQNLINASSAPPPIVSISYGECEAVNGAAANAAYNSTYQQAVAEGVSVYVAAGDSGGAGCDPNLPAAVSGIAVSAFASTPYNVAVGGTDFGDTLAGTNSAYWNSTNTANDASALSYIPEIPWNDSCAGVLLANFEGVPTSGSSSLCNADGGALADLLGVLSTAAGSGGPSGCATGTPTTSGVVSGSCAGYAKPPWQSVVGNPNDGVRDIPDVSLFAAAGLWSHYYVFCFSDTSDGGTACTGSPSGWTGAGGTSFASPIMAGVQALVNQKTGSRQGNPNPTLYSLANSEYGGAGNSACDSNLGNSAASSCIFYDITTGDMAVDCTGNNNCYDSAAGYGVLSTSNSALQPAYGTTTGWDFATGIGSVNVANLVNGWTGTITPPNPAVLGISKTHTGNFTQGQQGVTYTVVVANAATAGATSGTVTVSETVPSGLTLVSMAGTGWACAGSVCTRSDSLNPGSSYPAITVTVNVGVNALTPQVNQVNVSGGGSSSASASDSTTIVAIGGGAVANFVRMDTTTEGNWHGAYGADGYSVASESQSIPSYATFAVQNEANYTWEASTTDPRALQTGSGAGRIASTWYNNPTFNFDVNFTDGNPHQFALYAVDWDNSGRSETIQVVDGNTAGVLDTRTISGFSNGIYLVWNITGHVKIYVTRTAGVNAVISGAFFGGKSTVSSVVSFVGKDTTTEGSWRGVYGADGYSIANDTASIPSYANFTLQNELSYTWASSTTDPRALQNGEGTGRIASTWDNSPTFNFDVNFTDGKSHQFALYALDWDSAGRSENIQIIDATTAAVLSIQNISSFSNGIYLVWNITGHVKIYVTQTAGVNAVISGAFFGGKSNVGSGGSAVATFVGTDTSTEGSWHSVYGADGYAVANDSMSIPTYATFTPQSEATYTWQASTTDPRALETGSGTGRIASTWYNAPSFDFDVNFTDGKSHQFAVYALDWDSRGRSETIQVEDATSGSVLDARSISSFSNGIYLIWNISGHVRVVVTMTGPLNAVISGVFFGGKSTVTATATFVAADTTTAGTWKGVYGADGYSIANSSQSIPSYATFTPQNAPTYTWESSTTDPRALETSSGTGRTATTWYNAPNFDFDVNFTDGNVHEFAVYALDWDSRGRTQTLQVVDANTGVLLDTRNISSFSGGIYLIWNISGHVRVVVTVTGPVNAVASGAFFK